jgi:hypothetical protein
MPTEGMTDRLCPECGSTLGAKARYCGCGWGRKKKNEEPPDPRRIVCCHESCGRDSVVKIHTRTGWANVCKEHYDLHFQNQADTYCESRGLHTLGQKMEWVRTQKLLLKRIPVLREPGEDLDELGGQA